MKKKIYSAVLFAVVILIGIVFFVYNKTKKAEAIHIHAGFVVYVDGVKQKYDDIRYMNVTPCSEHSEKKSPEEEQIEKAHLHDGDGDVVHVHRKGAVWGDLFKNIDVTFDSGKEIVGYIEGQKVEGILARDIKGYESVVIVVGDQSHASEYVQEVPSVEKIKEVEKKSELCGIE